MADSPHDERMLDELARREHLWRTCGIPTGHREAIEASKHVSSWDEPRRSAAVRVHERAAAGGLVVLHGPVGTGKTHIAAALCCWAARSCGKTVRYRRFADLISQIRDEAYADGGSEARPIADLTRLGLLVIDEVDKRRWTDDEDLWLGRVIDHRYGERRPTMLIANLTAEGICDALGPAIVDRMHERGALVELGGPSQRGSCNLATEGVR